MSLPSHARLKTPPFSVPLTVVSGALQSRILDNHIQKQLEKKNYIGYSKANLTSARRFLMSVRCPRCEEVIPEKIFQEIQEWGPEAMKCPYCACPLNKSIFEKRLWDRRFPIPGKNDEDVTRLVVRKAKAVTDQIKKSASEFKKDYIG